MRSLVGLFGVGLMIAAIAAHFSQGEQVPWLYIAISSIIYAVLVIGSRMEIQQHGEDGFLKRLIWGGNIADILLALGTFFVEDFLRGVYIFLASAALGIAIAFFF